MHSMCYRIYVFAVSLPFKSFIQFNQKITPLLFPPSSPFQGSPAPFMSSDLRLIATFSLIISDTHIYAQIYNIYAVWYVHFCSLCVYGFKADHLILNNELGILSLEGDI